MRSFLPSAILASLGVAAVAAAPLDFSPADTYIASENMIVLRMVRSNGSVREFERVLAKRGALRSVGGWRGTESKGRIVVETPPDSKSPERYEFRRGRLVSYEAGGFSTNVAYGAERARLPEERSPLLASALPPPDAKTLASMTKKMLRREYASKWGRTGRLMFPYGNPNQTAAFWAEVALALFALAAVLRRRAVRAALAAPGVVSLAMVLWAGSRGAVLALCAALVVFALARRDVAARALKSRWFWFAVLAVAVVAVSWVVFKDHRFLMRGFGDGQKGWSNRVRLQMWMAAPRMIMDAFSGWGNAFEVGRAYMDWYQPLSEVSIPGSLINDHLTFLVGATWPLRILYVAAWTAAFALGAVCALGRRSAFPLAMLVLWFVCSWFNPVSSAKALWIGPAAACAVMAFRWRCFSRKAIAAVALSTLAACCVFAAVVPLAAGAWKPVDVPLAVRHVGKATYVNVRKNAVPGTWVVDTTGEAMGGILSAKGIRLFYAFNRKAEPIAVVRSVDDLPSEGVERLVLGGTQGDAWLKKISSSAKAREHLPSAVVFVSPPFPPEAVPPALRDAADVVFLVGEFAARYGETYAKAREGVVIVPGMEVYIENWLGLSMGVPVE